MGIDDFVDVGFGHVAIPDGFRVDHEIGAVLALIETALLVGPDPAFETALGQFLFEELLQPGLSEWIAAAPRMPLRTLVAADENVVFEIGHGA